MGDVERCRIRHFVWQQPSLPSAEHAGSSSALPSQLRELAKANRLIRRKLMDGCTCRLSRRLRTHRRRARTHQLTYRNSDNARRHHRLRVGCEVRAGGEDVARCCRAGLCRQDSTAEADGGEGDTKTSEFHRRRGQEVRRQRREGRRCRRQETTGQRQEAIGHDKKYKKADSGADEKYTVKHKKSAVLTSCSIPRPRTRWCVIVYACATRYGHYSSLS
jgi:hypothetical protein